MQLFLKAPRSGLVKTRLAKSIGAEKAAEIYQKLVISQLERLPSGVSTEIHFTPTEAAQEFTTWLGTEQQYFPQVDGGLGERLEAAVEGAFQRNCQAVICIGGDCPGLTHIHIEQTCERLNAGKDVVFGPTEDGGYYLIGLRQPQPELFRKIPWSHETTLKASIAKATELGLDVALLETLYDVDEAADLDRALSDKLIQA